MKPEKKNLISDLLAGLTFSLVNIPQSMAHALLTAVNPVFGLYTLMVATPVNEVFHRYTIALQANRGKLILASVSPALGDQLQRTGMVDLIGKGNIFMATKTIGEAGNAALRAATDWLAECSAESETSQEKEAKE
jgi:hypothetical protein